MYYYLELVDYEASKSLSVLHDSSDIPQPLHHGHSSAVC